MHPPLPQAKSIPPSLPRPAPRGYPSPRLRRSCDVHSDHAGSFPGCIYGAKFPPGSKSQLPAPAGTSRRAPTAVRVRAGSPNPRRGSPSPHPHHGLGEMGHGRGTSRLSRPTAAGADGCQAFMLLPASLLQPPRLQNPPPAPAGGGKNDVCFCSGANRILSPP